MSSARPGPVRGDRLLKLGELALRHAYPLLTVGSMAIGAVAVVRGASALVVPADSDLHNFFFKSADQILSGHPGSIYAARGDAPNPDPNDDPPLIAFAIAPFLWVARRLTADFRLQVVIVCLPFLPFVPLLGALVLRALRSLVPNMGEAQRRIVFALVAFSPLLWVAYSPWGHLEIPMMLCALVGTVLALQSRRHTRAGLLAVLALSASLTALFPLIALVALLLAGGERNAAQRIALISVVGFGLVMAPFLLLDRADTIHSLVTYRPTRPIGSNTIWTLVNIKSPHAAAALIRRLDMPAMLIFAASAGWWAGSRARASAYLGDVWGVLALGSLALPMLVKGNWPYYYAATFTLLLLWECSRSGVRRAGHHSWPAITLSYALVSATLAQVVGNASLGIGDRVLTGIVEFSTMAVTAFAVLYHMRADGLHPVQGAEDAMEGPRPPS